MHNKEVFYIHVFYIHVPFCLLYLHSKAGNVHIKRNFYLSYINSYMFRLIYIHHHADCENKNKMFIFTAVLKFLVIIIIIIIIIYLTAPPEGISTLT